MDKAGNPKIWGLISAAVCVVFLLPPLFAPAAGIRPGDYGWVRLGAMELQYGSLVSIAGFAVTLALAIPNLAPRVSLVPPGIEEQPTPAFPAWAADALAPRQAAARALIGNGGTGDERPTLRIAMPEGPGSTLIFAHLRRDWRAIGVEAERVAKGQRADLIFLDEVAPASLASWYLRHFTCQASIVCSAEADASLEAARNAATFTERRDALATADRLLTEATPFIPLAAPVRWSLVSPRLTGFQPNPFAIHFIGSLVAPRR